MKEVIRYECEFCNSKNYKHKSSCKSHEKKCYANPKTKSCRTCEHFVKSTETVYDRNHGGDPGSSDYEVETTWCGFFSKYLGLGYDGGIQFKTNCEAYISSNKDNFAIKNTLEVQNEHR